MSGTLIVSPGQNLKIVVGMGGMQNETTSPYGGGGAVGAP